MKHITGFKLFEATPPILKSREFNQLKEHIEDILQDLNDEGFKASTNLLYSSHMGYVSEFLVKIYKGTLSTSVFNWDEIKDRVLQIISSVNQETNSEFSYRIEVNFGEKRSSGNYLCFTSLEEMLDKVKSHRPDKGINAMTLFRIKFINKVINNMDTQLSTSFL